jgi:hypothetical protein
MVKKFCLILLLLHNQADGVLLQLELPEGTFYPSHIKRPDYPDLGAGSIAVLSTGVLRIAPDGIAKFESFAGATAPWEHPHPTAGIYVKSHARNGKELIFVLNSHSYRYTDHGNGKRSGLILSGVSFSSLDMVSFRWSSGWDGFGGLEKVLATAEDVKIRTGLDNTIRWAWIKDRDTKSWVYYRRGKRWEWASPLKVDTWPSCFKMQQGGFHGKGEEAHPRV